jgi:hypothetical protein
MLYVQYIHLTRPVIFVRDKPILLSERMLHKDYDRKGSVGGGFGHDPQLAWRQDKLISSKPPIIKQLWL